jgi:hypothetical protein
VANQSPVVATAIGFDSDSISTFRSGGRSTHSRRTMNSRANGSGPSWPGRGNGRGTTRSPTAGINPPTAYAEVVAPTTIATSTAASTRSNTSSARSTTSGVTMDDLSIAESRIMSQVTSDNNRILEQVQNAQNHMENRIDEQMQAFLATLSRFNHQSTPIPASPQQPTPTNAVTPMNTTNSTGGPTQASGQGR